VSKSHSFHWENLLAPIFCSSNSESCAGSNFWAILLESSACYGGHQITDY
jgi:hypothetical protein